MFCQAEIVMKAYQDRLLRLDIEATIKPILLRQSKIRKKKAFILKNLILNNGHLFAMKIAKTKLRSIPRTKLVIAKEKTLKLIIDNFRKISPRI